MRKLLRPRALLFAPLLGVALIAPPAHAVPIYPMLFVTINAPLPSTSAPTFNIDAQAPLGWSCAGPGLGLTSVTVLNVTTTTLVCQAPVAGRGLENTCAWNVVKIMSSGVRGNMYGEAFCDNRAPGANVGMNVPMPLTAAAAPDGQQFVTATCRVTTNPDALVRPWVTRCSTNH